MNAGLAIGKQIAALAAAKVAQSPATATENVPYSADYLLYGS